MMDLVTILIQMNHEKRLNSQRVHALWMQLDVEIDSILVYWALIADIWLNTFLESS